MKANNQGKQPTSPPALRSFRNSLFKEELLGTRLATSPLKIPGNEAVSSQTTSYFSRGFAISIRELTNRRLSFDDAVGFRDMPTPRTHKGTYRRRAKVNDFSESNLPAS